MSAKNAEKPRRLRKLLFLGALAAVVVLAVMYARCGRGFGLGGGGGTGLARGSGSGTGPGSAIASAAAPRDAATVAAADAAPARCTLRVDATGIAVGGAPATQDAAVAACKAAGAADVLVTGDAVQGTWDQLRAALTAAGVSVYVHGAATVDGGAASDVH